MGKNFKYLVLLHTVGTLPFFLFLMYRYCHHIAASLLGFDPLLLIFKKIFFFKIFLQTALADNGGRKNVAVRRENGINHITKNNAAPLSTK